MSSWEEDWASASGDRPMSAATDSAAIFSTASDSRRGERVMASAKCERSSVDV
ncbi:hypothetical protein AB0H77_27105 [Streptomyces sp. NPDC050844]|uniref:hypothetical protein n=1 Tax=Streptomyces sp. NPDC050844 TaxID=3155790 RepID=UPI0033D55FA9